MSSTRNIKSPGVFATAASTTIPPTPIAGTSYRDAATGSSNTTEGWPYAERVNSAEFNEIMFRYSTLLTIMDSQGILGWTNLVDYAVPAIVFGSDGFLYTAIAASGPGTAVKDPVSEPTFWLKDIPVVAASETQAGVIKIATNAEAQAFSANKAIDGAKLNTALQGSNQLMATNGYQKLPGGLIIQWGSGTGVGSGTVTYPIPFPNAVFICIASDYASGVLAVPIGTNPNTLSTFNWNQGSGANIDAFGWFAIGR